jgi:hypothetical protein
MDRGAPTKLTIEDIDKLIKQFEEDLKKPNPTTNCPSCGIETLVMFTDYGTGQCNECFYARKPWCQAAPVRDAYLKVSDA